MRTALYDSYGPPSVLYVGETPIPPLTPGSVRVRVHGTSVNGIDVALRSGSVRWASGRRFPRRTGLDLAGVVDATATDAFRVGDRVWGAVPESFGGRVGAAAEYVVVSPSALALAPPDLGLADAAGLVGVGVTAMTAIDDHARLRPGESVLVRGAAGGFGTAAVQLAASRGARVTALAGAATLDGVRALGAAEAYDYRTTTADDLGDFDVVLDAVGPGIAPFRRRADRTVTIVWASVPVLATVIRSSVRGRHRLKTFSGKPTAPRLEALTRAVAAGALRPVTADTFPLSDIAEAHESLQKGGHLGKYVIAL